MSQNLLQAPFAGFRRSAGNFVGNAREKLPVVVDLPAEKRKDWTLRNQQDVVFIVLGVFIALRAAQHDEDFATNLPPAASEPNLLLNAGRLASSLHQDDVAPASVETAKLFAASHDTKTGPHVQLNAGPILRQDSRLQG